jgi:integrase
VKEVASIHGHFKQNLLGVAEERGPSEKKFKLSRKKVYVGRLRFYSDEEVTSLLAHSRRGLDTYHLLIVGVETGRRLGEILALTPRDLDWKHEMVHLGATKGNKRRSIPMTKAAHAALTKQAKGKLSHERLFPERVNSRQISRVTAAWKAERGLPTDDEGCFHTFRHTTCSRLVQRGVPINVVMKFMGHTVIETTMRYAHLAPDSLALAKEALERN